MGNRLTIFVRYLANGPILEFKHAHRARCALECMMPLEPSGRLGAQQAVHLSRQQRLDLMKLVAAGIVSAIFIATPVLLSRETASGTPVETASAVRTPPPAAVGTIPRVEVVTTEIAAPVSIPTLQASRAASPTARRSGPARRARYALVNSRPRLPLGRRIVRIFAGDGSHTVRPFPTVTSAMR